MCEIQMLEDTVKKEVVYELEYVLTVESQGDVTGTSVAKGLTPECEANMQAFAKEQMIDIAE